MNRTLAEIKRICAVIFCICLVISMPLSINARAVDDSWQNRLDSIFTTDELMDATVSELQEAMNAGRLSSVELVGMYLERIEAYDRSLGLNSFITVNENALQEAELADEARKNGSQGRLLGIPIVVKDNIDVKGMPTTNGYSSRLDNIAQEDAEIIRRLREEGAIIIGKSNMSENSGSGATSRSSAGGRVHNAYDTSRTPAGSSGGSAVAVTCNFAVLGIGTDTNSSIRRPASFAGIYGLRPSFGLVSRSGMLVNYPENDVPGILARNAEDMALALDIIAGSDPADSSTSSAEDIIPEGGYSAFIAENGSLTGVRIGYLSNSFGYFRNSANGAALRYPTELSSRISQMVDDTVAVFRDNGAEVIDISSFIPEDYITRVKDGSSSFIRRTISEIIEDLEIDAVIYVSQTDVPEIETSATGRYDNEASYINIFSPNGGLPEVVIPMGLSAADSSAPVPLALGMNMFSGYGKDDLLLSIAFAYEKLSDARKMPDTVPALPDQRLSALAEELLNMCDYVTGEYTLSPRSAAEIAQAAGQLREMSMSGSDGASRVSVSEYRQSVETLCRLMDTAEIVAGQAPVRNVENLVFFIQKYRTAVSISSVSVLLFVFALVLTKPNRKTRKLFDAIPQLLPTSNRDESAADRIRDARKTVREQQKLLRQARRSLKKGESLEDVLKAQSTKKKEKQKQKAVPKEKVIEENFEGVGERIEHRRKQQPKQKKKVSLLRAKSTLAKEVPAAASSEGTRISRDKTAGKTGRFAALLANITAFFKKRTDSFKKSLSSFKAAVSGRLSAQSERRKEAAVKRAADRVLASKKREEAKLAKAEAKRQAEAKKKADKEAASLREKEKKAAQAELRRAERIKEEEERAEQARLKKAADAERLAEKTAAQRIRNAEKVEARNRELARKNAQREAAEAKRRETLIAQEAQKREKALREERKNASREKAAALRAQANLERKNARRAKREAFITSLKSAVSGLIAGSIAKIKGFFAAKSAARKQAVSDRAKAKAEALQIRQREKEEALLAKQQKLEQERERKALAEEKKLQERRTEEEKKEQERREKILAQREKRAEKAIAQKYRATVSLQKKAERRQKREAFRKSVSDTVNGVLQLFAVRKAERQARNEQAAIERTAKAQFKKSEKARIALEKQAKRDAATAAKRARAEELRRLKDERIIEKRAEKEFSRRQRKQRIADAIESVKSFFKNAAEARKRASEDRKIRRAEKLFLRNAELREKKRQVEELKAERIRLANESAKLELEEREKKDREEKEKRDAEAAYRVLIDQKVSEQVAYLEEKSAQRHAAEREEKRRKEEKKQERLARKAAEEEKRKEQRRLAEQEREAQRKASAAAEAERKLREEELRNEQRAEAAKRRFEKNKDKIIIAQRRELEARKRKERRDAAKAEAAARRIERTAVRKKKISLFIHDLPIILKALPGKIADRIRSFAKACSDKVTSIRTGIAEARTKRAKAREDARAENARKREEKAALIKQKRDRAEAEKRDRIEQRAVAARLKKQAKEDVRNKRAKDKERAHNERQEKRRAAAAARAAVRNRRTEAVRGLFRSVTDWAKGVFRSTESGVKRIFLLVAGVITFIFSIPKRLFDLLKAIPKRIAARSQEEKQKRLSRAEQKAYALEQKRISREKQSIGGIRAAAGQTDTDISKETHVPAASAEDVIINLQREAAFRYEQKSLWDFIRPHGFSMTVLVLSTMWQALCMVAVPEIISDALNIIRSMEMNDDTVSLMIKCAVIILSFIIMNFAGRASANRLARAVAKEMRRVEFSIRRERRQDMSLEDEIDSVQELVMTGRRYLLSGCSALASVIALCISSPANIALILIWVIAVSAVNKRRAGKLRGAKSVEDAVAAREAIAMDWARKLRVNKLLGRGRDSYENVRNAAVDVNIRVLARKDINTDSDSAVNASTYALSLLAAVVTAAVPLFGTVCASRRLVAGLMFTVLGPDIIKSGAEFRKIRDMRRKLAESVASKLSVSEDKEVK